MKIKTIIFVLLAGVAVLTVPMLWAEEGRANSQADKPAPQTADRPSVKIGVVSVRRLFQNSKKNAVYMEQAGAEQSKIIAELEKLSREIEAERAGLKVLKEGSSDYLTAMRQLLTKQASFQAQQEFHKQQMELKDHQWTEQLYKDILRHTEEVAKQKGLDLVFERDEVELPSPSANELMMTIRTHKLLYSGGCQDITADVLARLDAEQLKPQDKPFDGDQGRPGD